MPCVTSLLGRLGRKLCLDHALRRGDRGVGRRNPHLAQGLGLGAGDLVLGELHAPLEMLGHRAARLGRELLGLLLGEG